MKPIWSIIGNAFLVLVGLVVGSFSLLGGVNGWIEDTSSKSETFDFIVDIFLILLGVFFITAGCKVAWDSFIKPRYNRKSS